MQERLQKIIANSGYCSRRKAEELISSKKVFLNNDIAKLGDKVDITKDIIKIENKILQTKQEKYYYILNKPKGRLVTKNDPKRRKTIYTLESVKKLTSKLKTQLNYVGRLDALSEGLLVLTNDGELTNILTHPKYLTKKTYLLRTEPEISREDIEKIENGIEIDNIKTFGKIKNKKKNEFHFEISEGRNRIIRRILEEKLNYKIYLLKRISINNLKLGNLETGQVKVLTKKELEELNPL